MLVYTVVHMDSDARVDIDNFDDHIAPFKESYTTKEAAYRAIASWCEGFFKDHSEPDEVFKPATAIVPAGLHAKDAYIAFDTFYFKIIETTI